MITQNFYYTPSVSPPSLIRKEGSGATIERVELYQTHDLIRSHNSLKSVDLRIFRGNKRNIPLPHTFLRDFSDTELSDLVKRNEGRLPLEELREVRTLLRQVESYPDFQRPAYICPVCESY